MTCHFLLISMISFLSVCFDVVDVDCVSSTVFRSHGARST